MKRKSVFSVVAALVLMLLMSNGASAQSQWSQSTACKGWNNPSSFATGSQDFKYAGAGGKAADKTAPHVAVCTTSCTWSGINWAETFTAGQMNTKTSQSCATYSYDGFQQIPDHDRLFVIMDTNTQATTSGCPRNYDPNTKGSDNVYHLPFVPSRQYNTYDTTPGFVNTNLSTSIRIGDDCAKSYSPDFDDLNQSATALYYHLRPTSENALFFIYYAVVVTAPTHGIDGNPAFVIAVEKEKTPGCWVAVSDTLVYAITIANNMPVEPTYNTNGWHNAFNGDDIKFKDWTKVAINLNNHLYENLRIHVSISDCEARFHPAYAYICGECREMTLRPSGCPAGMSSDVTVLSAPRGMLRYQWSASEYGKSDPVTRLNAGGEDDYFSFRTLTMPAGTPHVAGQPAVGPEDSVFVVGSRRDTVHYYNYHVNADDFRVLYRPNINKIPQIPASPDSMGNVQVFRCRMTSALNPSIPFESDLYLNVTNKKPLMRVDSLSLCDGTVRLWNKSFVPGDPSLVVDTTTTWAFYNNEQAYGDADTVITGDSANYEPGTTNL